MLTYKKVPVVILLICFAFNVYSQTTLNLNLFASGLSSPVDIKQCGDSRLFVVEKHGYIQIVDSAGNLYPGKFLDIHTEVGSTGNEQGLLGMAFSPDYITDGFFYVNYTDLNGDSHVARFSVSPSNPDSAIASSEELLLKVPQPYANHNGGNLQFGPDGYMYIGFGDGGLGGDPGNRAQNHKQYLGKILRIDVSSAPGYSIPNDNPYVNDTSFYPEIWAYGVRNPWRYSFDKINGDLWIGEVGQDTWEEVDHHYFNDPAGMNYGWRCYEGFVTYNSSGCGPASNYVMPVVAYQHSASIGCSITGGYIYRGGEYASLFGKYFYTDFCTGNIWTLEDTAGNGNYVNTLIGDYADNQYSTFGEDRYGELYIAELYSGNIYRLGDSTCLPAAFISADDTMIVCGTSTVLQTPSGQGFLYEWSFNGSVIPGANASTYLATQAGNYSVQVYNASICSNISDTVYVTFYPVPAVNITGLANLYCINNTSVLLTGNPTGGNFSGPGVTGNIFNPSAVGLGTHTITYTYTDTVGCSNTDSKTVTVDACSFVNEVAKDQDVKIIPNPNNGNFELEIPGSNNDQVHITVSNLLGKIIFEKTGQAFQSGKSTISLDPVSQGIYFIKTNHGDKQAVLKFIVN